MKDFKGPDFFVCRILFVLCLCSIFVYARAEVKPMVLDSRIKTYIYTENEVFRLVVHYGYQTSIEFAENEEIQTISAGNNYAWQIVPVGRRLFIKPLEENVATNMTILTNKRAYHFDVESRLFSQNMDEELVYVVRFFYPDTDLDSVRPQFQTPQASADAVPAIKPLNFNYTYDGLDAIAPVKIFDDGTNTFFKFVDDGRSLPIFSITTENGTENLQPRVRGEYVVVNAIAPEIKLNFGKNIVTIYNEQLSKSDKR